MPKTIKLTKRETGIMLPITFAVLFVVSVAVVYVASMLFPNQVVLGTLYITPLWALIYSMTFLTLLNTFLLPVVREYEKYRGRMFQAKDWMVVYFATNFVGVWLITRFAEQIGVGVSSWVVVLFLAAVLDAAQGVSMMFLEKVRKNLGK